MSTLSQFMHGGAPRYYEEITASKTWTKPAGITTFFVEVFGGVDTQAPGYKKGALFFGAEIPSSVAIQIAAAGPNHTNFGALLTSQDGVQNGVPGNARTSSIGSLHSSLGYTVARLPGYAVITGW